LGIRERHFYEIAVALPALVGFALASDGAAAGCYSVWMNCFSIVEPDTLFARGMFWTAKFLPYGLPAYVPIALAVLWLQRQRGSSAVERFLWLAPLLFTALVHASCVAFESWVLPGRRLVPTPAFDLQILAGGYVWVLLVRLLKPACVWVPRYSDRA